MEYMKYVCNLKFHSRPDYSYLRSLFSKNMNFDYLFCKKNVAPNENFITSVDYKRRYLRERKPCRPVNGEVCINICFK